MAEFTIRPATAEDAEALGHVIARAYAPYRDRLSGMPDVTAGITEDIRKNDVWVASDGQRIVGGAILVSQPDGAKLANLAVDPVFSGKGIGRALIARVEDAARKLGHPALELVTHAAMTETRALYARLGWVEIGRDGVRIMLTKRLRASCRPDTGD